MVSRQRGDTLVEVLMSIVVLGVVIVGAVTLMTRGLQSAQTALEHSETRQEVNSQLEMLKFLRDQYAVDPASADAATWISIITGNNTNPFDYNGCTVTAAKAGTAFYLDKSSGPVQKRTFDASQVPLTYATAGKGLWIEGRPSGVGVSPGYIDFIVRACWAGAGSSGAQQQTVTAQRLYDPSR
jgi:prepilin-type N-terminal cleavage/methylation domain-containing protein